jgi:hypothetical protein
MTWIQTIPRDQAEGALHNYYEAIYRQFPPEYVEKVAAVQRPDGTSDSITAAHSLIPDAMLHAMSLLGALQRPELPLSRRQQEMIAAVVSAQNHCFY